MLGGWYLNFKKSSHSQFLAFLCCGSAPLPVITAARWPSIQVTQYNTGLPLQPHTRINVYLLQMWHWQYKAYLFCFVLNFNLYLLFTARFRLSFFSRLAFILFFSSRFRTSIKLNDMYQLTIDHQYSILTCVCTHTQPLFSNDLSIQIRCLWKKQSQQPPVISTHHHHHHHPQHHPPHHSTTPINHQTQPTRAKHFYHATTTVPLVVFTESNRAPLFWPVLHGHLVVLLWRF